MSRHQYSPAGWPATYVFAIGWDDALESYFAQVIDTSISGDECVILSLGTQLPQFRDVDALIRVVHRRTQGRLPPVEVAHELRRALKKDAHRPTVNAINVTQPEHRVPPPERQTAPRPWATLGSTAAFLDAAGLKEVLGIMADLYYRLESLYLARKAEGLTAHNDEDTKRVRRSLEHMAAICHTVDGMAQTPDILVARAALKTFQDLSAKAAQILHDESAAACTSFQRVH